MIREALDRMPLGARSLVAGVEVERVSLFGFMVGGWPFAVETATAQALVERWSERAREELEPGDAAEARIAQLRQIHGRDAVRVTGRARAKRARWMPGVKAKLVVSYPKERSER